MPEIEPSVAPLPHLLLHRPAEFQAGPQSGRLPGVVQGADHSGEVESRRALQPPPPERTARFALEVDDGEVLAGPEHLPEMEVAVTADPEGRGCAGTQALEALEDLALALRAPARPGDWADSWPPHRGGPGGPSCGRRETAPPGPAWSAAPERSRDFPEPTSTPRGARPSGARGATPTPGAARRRDGRRLPPSPRRPPAHRRPPVPAGSDRSRPAHPRDRAPARRRGSATRRLRSARTAPGSPPCRTGSRCSWTGTRYSLRPGGRAENGPAH